MREKLSQFPILNPTELEFLHRQEKIRLVVSGSRVGYGDKIALIRVAYWLRDNGYKNWIEIVYIDNGKFKAEELLGLPHDLPAEFKFPRYKISILPRSSFSCAESRSKIEYTNLGFTVVGSPSPVGDNPAELYKTKVFIAMSPYRYHDCNKRLEIFGDNQGIELCNAAAEKHRTKVWRFGSEDYPSIQENSETLAVRQTIPTLNEALLFLNKHPHKQLPLWLYGMVKSVQNSDFLSMPIYGIVTQDEYEHNALLTILMGMKQAKNISTQFNQKPKLIWVLHKLPQKRGLKELQSKIVLNHESLPTDVRVIPVDSSSSYVEKILANTTLDTIIIVETGSLPASIFSALYTSYDLLAVQEGASSANLLLNTQKAFLRCKKKPSYKYWEEIDMTNASPRLRNSLIKVNQFLCMTPDEFATSRNKDFPQVLGELMSEALNPTSELNSFFANFSIQTLTTDRLTLGLREAITIAHKFDLENTVLSPYYETAIAENPKFVLDGACNHLIPLKIFSPSMFIGCAASMRYLGDDFIPTALHYLFSGNFHFAEALAKNRDMLITEDQIPDRLLLFFSATQLPKTTRVSAEIFIRKCLDSVLILQGCKNASDIAKLKREKRDLSLLLKSAIAFDFKEQIELILDFNPDLRTEHNGWSAMRVAIAQKNSSLIKRFIDKDVTISAEDLYYAAKQIDDISTFALLEQHVAEVVDAEILLKNVIEKNNYKLLKFLAHDSYTHEAFRQEMATFLTKTPGAILYPAGSVYPLISPEVALEMVELIAHPEDFPLLLRKCVRSHTPRQLQTLLEAIEKNTDQFDQVISELSKTDSLPVVHLWMLVKNFPTHFPLEKFLPSIVQGITKSEILAEDLPELGKIVGDAIYTLGNHSLDELELSGFPVLQDTTNTVSNSQNHVLSLFTPSSKHQNHAQRLFTPVCQSDEQSSTLFIDFRQLLHNKQCQTTNTGILCTQNAAGQTFHLEIEAIGNAKSLVSTTQNPLETIGSDFLSCNTSSHTPNTIFECSGRYSRVKIYTNLESLNWANCSEAFLKGFYTSSVNIGIMTGIKYTVSGVLSNRQILRSKDTIDVASDLACLIPVSMLQPAQIPANVFFIGSKWASKHYNIHINHQILYSIVSITYGLCNTLLRYRNGENGAALLAENLGTIAAMGTIPMLFFAAKKAPEIAVKQVPKIVKACWNSAGSCVGYVGSFFGYKPQSGATLEDVMVDTAHPKTV